jgi:hypothetical protein
MKKAQKKAGAIMRPGSKPEVSEKPEAQIIALTKLLQMIGYTQEAEVSCDEVEQILDQFAELVQRGEDVKEMMPLVKNHVDLCPECREEFEALMRILESTE